MQSRSYLSNSVYLVYSVTTCAHEGVFLLLPVISPMSVSLHLSSVCPSTVLWFFLFCHSRRLQRFEGFRNDKTMPPSLEPSCSGATGEGPVAANHLRCVPKTHNWSLVLVSLTCFFDCFVWQLLRYSMKMLVRVISHRFNWSGTDTASRFVNTSGAFPAWFWYISSRAYCLLLLPVLHTDLSWVHLSTAR